ncbi:hypothetical protein EOJ36_04765 [Sandaracinomonas limnophila]|uniref:Uncharacterized protein n=1 Tax=Sandaracinomonas limnophila TaxID=1862386 RepID=A0A437PTZ1_9BACT|nr:hypothetical protein [Sandaracinomonas limnophila]RVU25732.1 hypothetical protein EOJ36_04765 [Sandaracinomonas limnophila]
MSFREIISLSAGIGFFIIWIIDLNAPTPAEIQGKFWHELFYHYNWLMFSVGCLFYFQYFKNLRVKNQETSDKKPNIPKKKK